MVRPPYIAALRLHHYAERYWALIDGESLREGSGIDYLTLPPDRFYNVVQSWVISRVRDAERFLRELERPMAVAGRRVTKEDLDADGESFVAFAQAFGVAPPAQSPGAEATAV